MTDDKKDEIATIGNLLVEKGESWRLGEGADDEACRVVSAWLLEQAEKAELREAAQYSGISMAKLRAILKSVK